MNIFVGAFLGALLLLLNQPARALVMLYAFNGEYPWWMVTPDDTRSPFGQYEAAVKKVYSWPWIGRYAGDVYWLGFRNCLYGLAFRFKPEQFHYVIDYSKMTLKERHLKWGVIYEADGYQQWTGALPFGFCIMVGWKVDNVVRDPCTRRQPVNMDFRPILSVRRAK